jgi:hypothetical protein
VHVKGTKREARDRYVPLLAELRPSKMTRRQFERALRASGLGVRPRDGRDSFALWCDLAGIPQGWKRALMGHQAENVTQEYGWQESERILNDAGTKLRALLSCQNNTRQSGGQSAGKPRTSNAPRRTRTPSLLIRSQVHDDSKRHAATKAAIPPRTREYCTESSPSRPDERITHHFHTHCGLRVRCMGLSCVRAACCEGLCPTVCRSRIPAGRCGLPGALATGGQGT